MLLPVAAVCLLAAASKESRETERIPVKTVIAEEQTIYNSVIAKGTVAAAESLSVWSGADGTVKTVFVNAGDTVKRGQSLLTIKIGSDAADGEKIRQAVIKLIEQELLEEKPIYSIQYPEEDASGEITVKSPMDGVILSIPEKGSPIFTGVSYLKLSDFTKLTVKARIPELYVTQLKLGQRANITGDAAGEKVLGGQVQSIAPYALRKNELAAGLGLSDSAQSYVETTLVLNEASPLKPGYTVDVKIFTDMREDAVLAPYEAVQQDENGEFVWVAQAGRSWRQPVRTGYELSSAVELVEGVKAGQTLLVSPPEGLQDGTLILESEEGI